MLCILNSGLTIQKIKSFGLYFTVPGEDVNETVSSGQTHDQRIERKEMFKLESSRGLDIIRILCHLDKSLKRSVGLTVGTQTDQWSVPQSGPHNFFYK